MEKAGAQVLAISMDDLDTLKRFKTELKAQFSFIPDPEGKVIGLFDVKMPMVSYAKRYSFVVGADRKILKIRLQVIAQC